ncbi:hypothetical protein OHA72_26175 [Dactylosporangium sp. NBC_01737]|uniref:hypothetical protein n=1 Tax=Dactylosporangium sp. NBC_01737 TaxID=2975959 RepID=UPI002E163252|nr:hypothetical protein OHA72_26175 [Dactylosporangium sp. NBC_01737]
MSQRLRAVVAVVDDRLCSLSAVQGALPLLRRPDALPLLVVYRVRINMLAALGAVSIAVAPPPLQDGQSHVFASVAALLAPSGVAWDFGVLEHFTEPPRLPACPDSGRTTFVAARHRLGAHLIRSGRAGAAGPPVAARLPVLPRAWRAAGPQLAVACLSRQFRTDGGTS